MALSSSARSCSSRSICAFVSASVVTASPQPGMAASPSGASSGASSVANAACPAAPLASASTPSLPRHCSPFSVSATSAEHASAASTSQSLDSVAKAWAGALRPAAASSTRDSASATRARPCRSGDVIIEATTVSLASNRAADRPSLTFGNDGEAQGASLRLPLLRLPSRSSSAHASVWDSACCGSGATPLDLASSSASIST
mmetsp:Transcript_1601/g.3191  ORF Transcript_1601/g.3191 Transcript_1601/m.3191 type:complete len:202 (-) Transcript_1601:390-995(-)